MINVEKDLEKIRFTYLFGAYTMHGEGFEIPLEIGACHKFYYVTEGEYELTIAGRTYPAKSGSLFFIPAGTPYSRRYIGAHTVTQYYFHFDLLFEEQAGFFEELDLPYVLDMGVRKDVSRLFDTIVKLGRTHTLPARWRLTAAVLNLLALYVEKSRAANGALGLSSDETGLPERENKTIIKLTKYIKDNIDRQITNGELAEIACMQENYFIRYFKKQTGMTPHRFITKLKIDTALGLLENTDISVGKAMEKVGYYDMSHFSRTFKQFRGIPPVEYIKKFRNTTFKSDGIEKG